MTTAENKIAKAKVKLILDHPFFATLALGMEFIEDNNKPTMTTDGKRIFWNRAFVDLISLEECTGVIAHECLHPMNLHHTRRNNRDPRKFNAACDYAINPILIDSKFKLPEGARIDPQFKDKSAEEIYRLLPDPPTAQNSMSGAGGKGQPEYGEGNDPGGCGEVMDAPATTQAELDHIEAEMKQKVAEAALVAKQEGRLPAGLERLIAEVLQPKISWKEVLQRFLTQITHSDYSWTKPNKRYLHAGLYLPSMESIETGHIVIIGDSSGSVWYDRSLIDQFAAEVLDITNMVKAPLKVIWVDTQVAGVEDIEPDEPLVLNPKGGGGTLFSPGFKYIDKEGIEPCALVYLTDGECSEFPKHEPSYPVLWCVADNKAFQAPFGEVLHITTGG